MLIGIAFTTWGGQIKERASGVPQSASYRSYPAAILLAVLCGLMAPMLNYSFAFGQDIAKEAIRLGTPAVRAGYAVWPIGLAGGFVPNIVYSVYLLFKNGTWSVFRTASTDF